MANSLVRVALLLNEGCNFCTDDLLGTLVGVYATSNGGNGTTESYFSRWRYMGRGQDIGNNTIFPYSPYVEGH